MRSVTCSPFGAAALAHPATAVVSDQPPVGSGFAAAGHVYGVGDALVTIQAARSGLVIVRGGDAVYFSRYLQAGEAYNVPRVHGLTVEASNPAGMRVYVANAYRGPLTLPLTPLSQFGN